MSSTTNANAQAAKDKHAAPLTTEPALPSTIPDHALTTHPLPVSKAEDVATPAMSINKDSGSEVPSRRSTQEDFSKAADLSSFQPAAFQNPAVSTNENSGSGSTREDFSKPSSERTGLTTASQFASPAVMTPSTPANNFGSGTPRGALSTTTVDGHESVHSGIDPPPPSAVGGLASFSSGGPTSSTLPVGAPHPSSVTSTLNSSIYSKNDSPTGAPSSVISVKSGVVGSGPTEPTGPIDKSLPPTPAGMNTVGATPHKSELDKDDLSYLAPHIRAQNSTPAIPTVKPTHAMDDHVPDSASSKSSGRDTSASRFTEGSSAHATPASETSSHSRDSSDSPHGSKRVSLVNRIKGEAKVIAGKIKKDDAKVQEGRTLLGDN